MDSAKANTAADRWAAGACAAAATLAAGALAGWFTETRWLTRLVPAGPSMVVNAALSILALAGGTFACLRGRLVLARCAGVFAGALGLAVLWQTATGRATGIDDLFWNHSWSSGLTPPGRMAPNAAATMVLLGAVLLLLGSRWARSSLLPVIVGAVIAFALLPLLSYGSLLLLGRGQVPYHGMAMPSVLAVLLLSGAILRAQRRARPGESTALTFMAAAFGMLVSIAVITVQSNEELVTADRQLVNSHAVRSELDRFVAQVARMESSARAYALTGRDNFRQRLAFHEAAGRGLLQAIAQRVPDNPAQGLRLGRLDQLFAEKTAQVRELTRQRTEFGVVAAADYLDSLPVAQARALVNLVDEMEAEEARLLREREARLQSVQRSSRLVGALGGCLAVALLGGAVAAARRESRARSVAEQALDRQNQMQRAIIDGTVFSVIAARLDGTIQEFNAGAEQMLRYSRAEMVDRRTLDSVHLESELAARASELGGRFDDAPRPGFAALVDRARRGESDQREWTYVRGDGTRLPVLVSLTPLSEPNGTLSGFLAVAQDLSVQQQAVQAMRSSEDRLRLVLGQADCLVWEARVTLTSDDWDWRFVVHPSGMYDRLFGENRIPAGLWYQFEIPEREEMNVRSRDAMVGGKPGYAQEFRLIRDGKVTWIRESVSIARPSAGHFWLVGVATDVTRLREMTASLVQSEKQFRTAFDYAGIGMALVGLDGRWLQVNRVTCQIVGYNESELLRKKFQDITHPDDLNADLAQVAALLAGRTDHYQMEKRYIHRSGHVVSVSLTVSLVRNAGGAPAHLIAQIEDITERKQLMAKLAAARDEALTASRLKSEFLANMSHEIRTPMNGVIGMADLLMETNLTDEQRQMGRVIRSSAENLLTILNDILDFSKIEAGKLTIDAVPFSLAAQVHQAVSLLRPRAQAKNLDLRVELPPDLPANLSGDPGRIQQVLINLLGNAIKFTDAGGVSVVVQNRSSERPGRYAFAVEVRDTGIGLSVPEQERLFQSFAQADGSTTRRYGGTGLGLAISRQLVELMGGAIRVRSRPGQGSTFSFMLELPVADGPRPAALVSSPPFPVQQRALHFLVAEDNPANQLVIRMLLEKMGASSEIVPDGKVALERLAVQDYAAVLMDCQMPVLDGYETARRIRAGAGGIRDPRIPIIALTAHAMASDRAKCLAAGMDDYLAKPIRIEALQQAFDRLGLRDAVPVARQKAVPTTPDVVLDPEQIRQLMELPGRQRPTLLGDLVDIAMQEVPANMVTLRDAVARRAGPEVRGLAHRLAGSAANLGAVALRRALQAVETAGAREDWPAADEHSVRVATEWAEAHAALLALAGEPRR